LTAVSKVAPGGSIATYAGFENMLTPLQCQRRPLTASTVILLLNAWATLHGVDSVL
jgi:hypothetical protein